MSPCPNEEEILSRAVLVAIAIPVFTNQLEKSRDSVSISNIRSAYSEASIAMLTSNGEAVDKVGNITVAKVNAGTQDVTVDGVELKGTVNGWSDMDGDLPFDANTKLTDSVGGTPGTYQFIFSFDIANNTCKIKSIPTPS